MEGGKHESDKLLRELFEPKQKKVQESLEELFLNRVASLDISKNKALKIMDMTVRSLDGILSGEQTRLDYIQFIKLANFLGVEIDIVAKLYLDKIKEVHKLEYSYKNDIVDFINNNFDLAALRKVGLIESLTDYEHINTAICRYFGLKDIFDYSKPNIDVAFSSGKRATMGFSLDNWVWLSKQTCIELRSTYDYNRENLINYFPNIRWHSMNVSSGLVNVIKHLYRLGITVVFIPYLPSIHIRGATFCINNRPCIALTDYVGFYPTLWFALIHELFHVLFDWEEIILDDYHISLENKDNLYSISPQEEAADNFASEYLFSKEKVKKVSQLIRNHELVKEYATANHVHPSFPYLYYAYQARKTNKYAWGKARNQNPTAEMEILKKKLGNPMKSGVSFDEHIKKIRKIIYY